MMTTRVRTSRRKNCGFTLIEMVMVIIITGIIASMVAIFIRSPVEGYLSSVRRAELTDAADVALRRFARDVRLALPNSLRTTASGSVNYVEFIMTSTGGRYRDSSDGSTAGNFLSFTDTAKLSFDVLGMTTNTPTAIAVGDYIVVYNLGPGYEPGNAYDCSAGCNRAQVASVSCTVSPCTVTINSPNPFASQSPPLPSPSSRFQVVPGGTQAVTFACVVDPTPASCPAANATGDFRRYWNYVFSASQPTTTSTGIKVKDGGATKNALLSSNAVCAVSYSPTALGRNGLLSITLKLTDTNSGECVTLFREIHVDNSP